MSPIIAQVLGWFFVGACAMFSFMGGAIIGGGYANQGNTSRVIISFFNYSMLLMPALCIIFGILMTVGHIQGWAIVYRWALAPPILLALWFVVAFKVAG